MRRLRWKTKHATGDPDADRRNQALVDLVNGLGTELARKEHCQDMNEVFGRLADLTGEHLEGLGAGSGVEAVNGAKIRRLLTEHFPLAARSTPACRDCGLCDLMEERVRAWLSEGNGR